jgi:hypothetical protein
MSIVLLNIIMSGICYEFLFSFFLSFFLFCYLICAVFFCLIETGITPLYFHACQNYVSVLFFFFLENFYNCGKN